MSASSGGVDAAKVVEHRRHVVDEDVAAQRALHEQAPVRREHRRARERADVADGGEHLRGTVDVANLDAVRARERQDGEVAVRAEVDVDRLAAIVEIDPAGVDLLRRLRIDDGGQRPHRRVVREVSPVPQLAAHDVVLLAGDPRLAAVGRERDREQIVGNAARPLIAVLGLLVELQQDARRDRHRRRVDLDDLAARVRRDEAGDVDVLAVVRHRDPARPRTDLRLADDVAGLRIELEQLADGHQRDVRGVAGGAHGDADGLRRVGQAKAALDDESIRVDDRDGVVVLVDDPQLALRCQRERLRPAIDRELGDLLQLVRVD